LRFVVRVRSLGLFLGAVDFPACAHLAHAFQQISTRKLPPAGGGSAAAHQANDHARYHGQLQQQQTHQQQNMMMMAMLTSILGGSEGNMTQIMAHFANAGS